jgi:4-diphosphocytidyl-2-C-methyl-D-erythritol kinase
VNPVAEAAPAKVNLYLHVLGRREEDGYHLLDSLVVFAGAADRVEAVPAAGGDVPSVEIEGPEAAALSGEDPAQNLVLRAARALAQEARIGAPATAVTLRLTKRLPVASGIGGGSADAAATLRALNRLWGLGWPRAWLEGVARRLGADVPACIAVRPVRLGGIGEALAPSPRMPARLGLVLANPRLPLATPAVFAARTGGFSAPATLPEAGWDDAAGLARDLAALRNDLEPAAIGLCPPVAEVLAALRALPGCLLARMSGSGATCFALMADAAAAAAAAARLPRAWWRWGGGLYAAAG